MMTCNLVIVLDPEFTTFQHLSALVRKGYHLFLPEKQRMTSIERMKLIQLAEEGNSFIQIRNDLLFHPSFVADSKKGTEPKLLEIHHFAPGKQSNLQEMIYSNLLMILKIIDSEPSRINVCSIPNSSDLPEVMNLHLVFNNGSAATLTISFTGKKKEHLLSIYSPGKVISYNFREDHKYFNILPQNNQLAQIFNNNLLIKQISSFSECILKNSYQKTGLNEEAKAFLLIEKINKKMEMGTVLI
jgi:hypothetical protein